MPVWATGDSRKRRIGVAILGILAAGGSLLLRSPSSGSVPLPNDASIYGSISEGAFYLFREEYLDCNANGVCGEASECALDSPIDRVCNGDNPGTRDVTFSGTARPLWKPSGGPDSRGCASFDGVNDAGSATGFSYDQTATTNNPSILIVGSASDVIDRYGVGVTLRDSVDGDPFLHAMHIRTGDANDTWQANGNLVNSPHAINYLTPEASSDTAAHLHETHVYSTGMVAFYDGTEYTGGGSGGTVNTIDQVRIGQSSFGEEIEGCISEVVITEGRTSTEASNYRCLRVAEEYPSLTIAGC